MSQTILVVDDQPDIRLLVRMRLGREWSVLEAADGAEALARCDEHDVAMIVLDQRMPELSGTEVARVLRGRGDDVPIVLFSAYLDEEVEAAADELGLLLLSKTEIGQLREVVRRTLDGSAG